MTYKQEAKQANYRAPEYNVQPFWQMSLGGHFGWSKYNKIGR